MTFYQNVVLLIQWKRFHFVQLKHIRMEKEAMSSKTKKPPATVHNRYGKAITATERSYEILRRVSFARNTPFKSVLEELTELLADEARMASKAPLPELAYEHEID